MAFPSAYQIKPEDEGKSVDELASTLGTDPVTFSGMNNGMKVLPPRGTMIVGPAGKGAGGAYERGSVDFKSFFEPVAQAAKSFVSPYAGRDINQAAYTGEFDVPTKPGVKSAAAPGQVTNPFAPGGTGARETPRTGAAPTGAAGELTGPEAVRVEQERSRLQRQKQAQIAVDGIVSSFRNFENQTRLTGIEDLSLLPASVSLYEMQVHGNLDAQDMLNYGYKYDQGSQVWVNQGGQRDPVTGRIVGQTGGAGGVDTTVQRGRSGQLYQLAQGGKYYSWKPKRRPGGRLVWVKEEGKSRRSERVRGERRARQSAPVQEIPVGTPVSVLDLKIGSG